MSNKQDYRSNELIDRLPRHLKQFIKPQNYQDYSPVNQAVWRYVMRRLLNYLKEVAHSSYLTGLEKTGVSIQEIPNMYGMNRILKEIGWAAVAVDGFIPPNAFMEFQAYKVLVIASDIRQLENIEYTPAPDIIHESAGHAPIIANPDYAEYLRRLGDIGSKAILSKHDMDLYEAVRKLSILKEAEGISEKEIHAVEMEIHELQSKKVELSEMAQMRNLQWWTVEYGLIGDLNNPKIYGAGLLSSIGESISCLKSDVKKIPYTMAAAKQPFDVTKPQPQLYVTPSFPHLMQVLEEFADTLSLRRGGSEGIQKLIESQMLGSIELTTGLQVSGKFSRVILDNNNNVVFFQTKGPSALAYREKELIGHGINYHKNGFSSPLGKLKNIELAIEDMGPSDLKTYHFYDGEWLSFEFESGIKVEGLNITGIRNAKGKLILIRLKDCTITYKEEFLFLPEHGIYDMIVGKDIVSAFAGAADSNSFPNLYAESSTLTIKPAKNKAIIKLEKYYEVVGNYRKEKKNDCELLKNLFLEVSTLYPKEWLLFIEIIELSNDAKLNQLIKTYFSELISLHPELDSLISDGIKMIKS
ncbi:aromatic amino acid hydroxylase [Flavobacteriaceae bacterium]|nr:aromatic amino acid hydroxylase [Flavobacteriaceae bacterium]